MYEHVAIRSYIIICLALATQQPTQFHSSFPRLKKAPWYCPDSRLHVARPKPKADISLQNLCLTQ